MRIDLNCDLGEDPAEVARDEQLLALVTSANVACGGHAGDEASMRHMARAARQAGVALGAHPGYPDRVHFGRHELEMSEEEIAASVAAQVESLRMIARDEGVALVHVKPHGALYNRVARDPLVAAAVADGVARVDGGLRLVGLAGSRGLLVWQEMGWRTVPEAFADRRYEVDGSLRSRRHADAVLAEPALAVEQAVRIAREGWIRGPGNEHIAVVATTLCVHSDTPGAVEIARRVRRALIEAGIQPSADIRTSM